MDKEKFKGYLKKLHRLIRSIFIPEDITIKDGIIVTPPKPIAPYIVIGLIIAIYVSSWATNFSLKVLIERIDQPIIILKRMWPPNLDYWTKVVDPLLETIQISFLGSFFGSILALPFAFLASSNLIKSRATLVSTRIFLGVFRTLPIIIYASIFTKILGYGAFAGVLAITLFTFSIVSKMLYEKIETLDLGAFEALLSTGASRSKAFVTAIMPQILPSYYSMSLYSLEINIRYAAILGYVGAGGIGYDLDMSMQNFRYDDTAVILFFILVVVVLIESLSRYLRGRLS